MSTPQDVLLDRYAEAVVNAPINLTSETNKAIFRERHVADAIALDHHIASEAVGHLFSKVLDVGSGNGVPGLVFAILHPEWQIDLLDSSNKKCLFLDTFIKNNAIENAAVHCGRAEDLAHTNHRETYDLVVCRALEKLPTAIELTIPFLKPSGLLIVSHGTSWQEELQKTRKGLELLRTSFKKAVPYTVQSTTFYMLMFEKIGSTPEHYPRNVGIPTKRPL